MYREDYIISNGKKGFYQLSSLVNILVNLKKRKKNPAGETFSKLLLFFFYHQPFLRLPAEEARESARYNVHRDGKVDCYYP